MAPRKSKKVLQQEAIQRQMEVMRRQMEDLQLRQNQPLNRLTRALTGVSLPAPVQFSQAQAQGLVQGSKVMRGPMVPGGAPMPAPVARPARVANPRVAALIRKRFTKKPGDTGFNAQCHSIMRSRGKYIGFGGTLVTNCSGKSSFAHTETAAWLVGPETPIDRMLVVHRTGSGKTTVMTRVLEEYFDDPRAKIVIFPNQQLVDNFYNRLHTFPTKYKSFADDWFARNGKANTLDNFKDLMEMKGRLSRRGTPGELVAPIRPFRYSIAGGSTVLGKKAPEPPVFKIGFSGGNPFDNKIVLMDEVHNLVVPPQDADRRMQKKLDRLREALFSAKDSVIVGLTATPMVNSPEDGEKLLAMIKGAQFKGAQTNEGFVSYFNALPSQIYPIPLPGNQAVRVLSIPMADHSSHYYWSKMKGVKTLRPTKAEKAAKTGGEEVKVLDKQSMIRGLNYCNMAGYYAQATQSFRTDLNTYGPRNVATKLYVIANEVLNGDQKTAIIVDNKMGFKGLREVFKKVGGKNLGKVEYLEKPPSGKKVPSKNPVLERFNDKTTNGRGEKIKIIVLDAASYGEGIDLIGVRRLILVNPPLTYSQYKQYVGRVFRACGHDYLTPQERNVVIEMYVSKFPVHPKTAESMKSKGKAKGKNKVVKGKSVTPPWDQEAPPKTADEMALESLQKETMRMETALRTLFALPASDRRALGHP